MPIVEVDGQEIEFPDDMSQDAIKQALQKRFPAPEKPNAFMDSVSSIPTGIATGLSEAAMLPVTANRLLQSGTEYINDKAIDPFARAIFGLDPMTQGQRDERRAKVNAAREESPLKYLDVNRAANKAQDATRGFIQDEMYQPKTTAGEYTRTLAEFAAPGGLLTKGTKLARTAQVAVPAVASETAGQMTEGKESEGMARFMGALLGGLGTAAVQNSATKADTTAIRKAMPNMKPEQWYEAKRIQINAKANGIDLPWPLAVQQATGGATKITDTMRVVEGAQSGGAVMQPVFSAMPKQVDEATSRVLDTIAPAPQSPSTLGPQAAKAAQGVIDDELRALNAETDALYKTAETAQLRPLAPNAGALIDQPVYVMNSRAQSALANTDNVPEMAVFPENTVGRADEARKTLRGKADTAQVSGDRTEAARYGSAAEELEAAARAASQEYETALNIQASRRKDIVDPLTQGPVGSIANSTSTESVLDAILPKAPLRDSEQEVAKTLMRLGEKNPELAQSLVRQSVGQGYEKASKDIMSGANYYSGPKFANEVAGTRQQKINLDTALRSIPGQQNPEAFSDYLDVLRAIGQRKAQGSATSFNAELLNDLSTGSAAQRAANTAVSPRSWLTQGKDMASRAWLGRNVENLADMFIDPEGMARARAIVESGQESLFQGAGKNLAVTAPPQLRDRPTEEERKKRKAQSTRIDVSPSAMGKP